jgi:hypothetical protein
LRLGFVRGNMLIWLGDVWPLVLGLVVFGLVITTCYFDEISFRLLASNYLTYYLNGSVGIDGKTFACSEG